MTGLVSYYPQVTEWMTIGAIAINLAQVASIEFGPESDDPCAIVRLSAYTGTNDREERNKTWFTVTRAELVNQLRAYVARLSIPDSAEPSSRR